MKLFITRKRIEQEVQRVRDKGGIPIYLKWEGGRKWALYIRHDNGDMGHLSPELTKRQLLRWLDKWRHDPANLGVYEEFLATKARVMPVVIAMLVLACALIIIGMLNDTLPVPLHAG